MNDNKADVFSEPSPTDERDRATIGNNPLWQKAMEVFTDLTILTSKVTDEETDEYRACQAAERACWTLLVTVIDLHCRCRMIEVVTGKKLPGL